MFVLDPAFPATSAFVADLPLCQARLQADARWPWLVLVPRVAGMREIEDLAPDARASLMDEILAAGRAVRALGVLSGREVEKLNIAALGNVTPQLHIHVVGRRADDAAWPGPVWGFGAAEPYEDHRLARTLARAREALSSAAG
jgi:diadenosine tetraphosphate (Ap4A) HIT family hydrolase